MSEYSEYTLVELGEAISGPSHLLGIASGFQEAANYLLEKSGRLFADGKDDQAILIRNLSKELMNIYQVRRKHYDDLEQPRYKSIFDELDSREKQPIQ